jgi:hypothetical protein
MFHSNLPTFIQFQLLQIAEIVSIDPANAYSPMYDLMVAGLDKTKDLIEVTVPAEYILNKVPGGKINMAPVVPSAPLTKINPSAAVGGFYIQHQDGTQDFRVGTGDNLPTSSTTVLTPIGDLDKLAQHWNKTENEAVISLNEYLVFISKLHPPFHPKLNSD